MSTRPVKHSRYLWVALVVLLVSATTTQVVLEGKLQRPAMMPGVHWIQSPGLMRRLAVGFNAIWADIYWIRAVQYYGDTKLSTTRRRTTTCCIRCSTSRRRWTRNSTSRIGSARFCCPRDIRTDPGRPIRRSRCCRRAFVRCPASGSTTMTPGSSSTWWRRDSQAAADWFLKASKLPGAPNWLRAARGKRAGRARGARGLSCAVDCS